PHFPPRRPAPAAFAAVGVPCLDLPPITRPRGERGAGIGDLRVGGGGDPAAVPQWPIGLERPGAVCDADAIGDLPPRARLPAETRRGFVDAERGVGIFNREP